jgi:hypothetical protein
VEAVKDLIISEVKELAGVEAGKLFEIGLINEKHARKWVVRKKYFELAKTGRTYTDIKLELSVDYGVSVSMIEKLVYGRY